MKGIDLTVWKKWRDFEIEEESPGFFLQLLSQALESTPKLMQELEVAMQTKDLKKVFFSAHTLASTCISLGATELGRQLREIEHSTKQSPPVLREDLMGPVKVAFVEFMQNVNLECASLSHKKAG